MRKSARIRTLQAFQKFDQRVAHLRLEEDNLNESVLMDKVVVTTIAEVMAEVRRQHTQLSDADFLPYYAIGADIIKRHVGANIEKTVLLSAYEELGESLTVEQTPQSHPEFGVLGPCRDWKPSSKKQVKSGPEVITQEWPRIGRNLLACEEKQTKSYVRQLKAMCGKIKDEEEAINRISRAMLNRVDDNNTRRKMLVPNYADIMAAKALTDDFEIPTDSEIKRRGLYFDGDIGLVTDMEPEE
ncbi:hypothetical protein BJY01DRAFT_249383 [Aspergillus pseudoustus]|uniref:Uncharacterized protein n=1 Tax=Aspergillus pseudoustus TaxID=1810923 RepID=A0ABR4JPC5_9EURO